MRRPGTQLPADRRWLELHRAAVPAARRGAERRLEFPAAAAGQLSGPGTRGFPAQREAAA
ncbi:hypothetical protein CBM2587_B10211 [Cupriavidus taiwanensis]|uniref:Uncharacterized protein n=1 Tax=Cupriavidus taiwanensis TaxID=164546 RepID=A0A375BXW5_9BURK|nr:hypothetical protein CBM2587_B10211 [Cupriavidus taiwanensis]